MSGFVSKHLQWFRNIRIKSFRTEKAALAYMKKYSEQNWYKVDASSLPKRALKVFDTDPEGIEEFYTFFENDLSQFLLIEVDDSGILYNISLAEYINKENLIDTDDTPILINFFKPYKNNASDISKLFELACSEFGFNNLTKAADVKLVNKWVIQQMENDMRPIYFQEKPLAYLIIIIGELLLKNKLTDYVWDVEKTFLDPKWDTTEVKSIYVPYLINNSGSKLDIYQAFREYLFLEAGNIRNVFTNVYNNIEKYEFAKMRGQTLPYLMR